MSGKLLWSATKMPYGDAKAPAHRAERAHLYYDAIERVGLAVDDHLGEEGALALLQEREQRVPVLPRP